MKQLSSQLEKSERASLWTSLCDYLNESLHEPARIFVIIKPGFFKYSQQILERFAVDGWEVEKSRTKQLLLKEAKRLYSIHKKEDWYKPLCEYMSSEPTTAFILINKKRQKSPSIFDEVGSIKDEIRNEYGESDMRNVMHSSDSFEHMRNEMSVYF